MPAAASALASLRLDPAAAAARARAALERYEQYRWAANARATRSSSIASHSHGVARALSAYGMSSVAPRSSMASRPPLTQVCSVDAAEEDGRDAPCVSSAADVEAPWIAAEQPKRPPPVENPPDIVALRPGRELGREHVVPHRRALSPRASPAGDARRTDTVEKLRRPTGWRRFAAFARVPGGCGRTSANPGSTRRKRRRVSPGARASRT